MDILGFGHYLMHVVDDQVDKSLKLLSDLELELSSVCRSRPRAILDTSHDRFCTYAAHPFCMTSNAHETSLTCPTVATQASASSSNSLNLESYLFNLTMNPTPRILDSKNRSPGGLRPVTAPAAGDPQILVSDLFRASE